MRLRPHWRKMTWVLILWVALVVLFIVGINNVDDQTIQECLEDGTSRELCELGDDFAAGVWTAIGVIGGFMGFVVLGIIWLMTKPRRHCPACGNDAKKGITRCTKCGYLFTAAAVRPTTPGAPPLQWAPPPPPPSSGSLPPPSGPRAG
jgi:hypothetical protein